MCKVGCSFGNETFKCEYQSWTLDPKQTRCNNVSQVASVSEPRTLSGLEPRARATHITHFRHLIIIIHSKCLPRYYLNTFMHVL